MPTPKYTALRMADICAKLNYWLFIGLSCDYTSWCQGSSLGVPVDSTHSPYAYDRNGFGTVEPLEWLALPIICSQSMAETNKVMPSLVKMHAPLHTSGTHKCRGHAHPQRWIVGSQLLQSVWLIPATEEWPCSGCISPSSSYTRH